MMHSFWKSALLLFLVAVITDGLDGFLARKLGQQTWFGALFDALTDKVMIISWCGVLAALSLMPFWLFALIIAKELCIMLGAAVYVWCTNGRAIQPSFVGKVAVVVEAGYVALVIAQNEYQFVCDDLFFYAHIFVAVCALMALGGYLMNLIYLWYSKVCI